MPKFQRRLHSTRSKTDDSEVPRTLPTFVQDTVATEPKPAAAPEKQTKKESAAPESDTKLALKLALKEKHMRKRKAFMDSLCFSTPI